MIIGAVKLTRFTAYELVLVTIILAMIPWSPAWLIGFPVGIWALRKLRQPNVQAAFLANLRRQQGLPQRPVEPPRPPVKKRPAAGPLRRRVGGFVKSMLSVFVPVSRTTGAAARPEAVHGGESVSVLQAGILDRLQREPVIPAAAVTPPPALPRGRVTDLAGMEPFGVRRRRSPWGKLLVAVGGVLFLVMVIFVAAERHAPYSAMPAPGRQVTSTEMALLRDRADQAKRLRSGDQKEALLKLLEATDFEYEMLEVRHTTSQTNRNTVTLDIYPFPEEAKALEDQFWKDLNSKLPNKQLVLEVTRLLPVDGVLYPLAKDSTTRIVIRKSGPWYDWTVNRYGGLVLHGNGPQLPKALERFWKPTDE
jgi:hypothetical protein